MAYSIHNLTIVKYNPQFTYEVIMSHWGFIGVAIVRLQGSSGI